MRHRRLLSPGISLNKDLAIDKRSSRSYLTVANVRLGKVFNDLWIHRYSFIYEASRRKINLITDRSNEQFDQSRGLACCCILLGIECSYCSLQRASFCALVPSKIYVGCPSSQSHRWDGDIFFWFYCQRFEEDIKHWDKFS